MLSDELVDFHPEASQFHHMTDADNSLTHREGPELLKLPLGNPNLLTGDSPSGARARGEQITAPFATDTKLLPPLPDNIPLLDLGSASQCQLGRSRSKQEFSSDRPLFGPNLAGDYFCHEEDVFGTAEIDNSRHFTMMSILPLLQETMVAVAQW